MRHAQIGAIFYGLWGLLHVIGGIAILAALGGGAEAGFAVYQNAEGAYPAAAGAILGMNSFAIALIGVVVITIAATLNRRNSPVGAALNLLLAGGMDVALAVFLLRPGYVSLGEALIGFGLLAFAALFSALSLLDQKPQRRAPPAIAPRSA